MTLDGFSRPKKLPYDPFFTEIDTNNWGQHILHLCWLCDMARAFFAGINYVTGWPHRYRSMAATKQLLTCAYCKNVTRNQYFYLFQTKKKILRQIMYCILKSVWLLETVFSIQFQKMAHRYWNKFLASVGSKGFVVSKSLHTMGKIRYFVHPHVGLIQNCWIEIRLWNHTRHGTLLSRAGWVILSHGRGNHKLRKRWRATAWCGKSKFTISSGWLTNGSLCHPDDIITLS